MIKYSATDSAGKVRRSGKVADHAMPGIRSELASRGWTVLEQAVPDPVPKISDRVVILILRELRKGGPIHPELQSILDSNN